MFKKAEKLQTKLKIGLSGPSGSGKSFSALRLASGISDKIAVIDTENNSASLYSDVFNFYVLELHAPYTVDKYLAAIELAIKNKYEILVIDSLTHVWDAEGGILNYKTSLDQRGGNSYANWRIPKDLFNKLKSKIISAPIHIITTVRSKQQYLIEESDKGKSKIKKGGADPIIEPGYEYETTLWFEIGMDHLAFASKDRTTLFPNDRIFKVTEETGKELITWLKGAKVPIPISPTIKTEVKTTIPPGPRNPSGEGLNMGYSYRHSHPSEAQLKRLFAKSKSNDWTDEDVKSYMVDNFGKSSTKELTMIEYEQICIDIDASKAVLNTSPFQENEERPPQ